MFLSVAGGRTHIGTYVGVSPSPASNENNLEKIITKVMIFYYQINFQILEHKYFSAEKFFLLGSGAGRKSPKFKNLFFRVIHSFTLKSIVFYFYMRDN